MRAREPYYHSHSHLPFLLLSGAPSHQGAVPYTCKNTYATSLRPDPVEKLRELSIYSSDYNGTQRSTKIANSKTAPATGSIAKVIRAAGHIDFHSWGAA